MHKNNSNIFDLFTCQRKKSVYFSKLGKNAINKYLQNANLGATLNTLKSNNTYQKEQFWLKQNHRTE